MDDNNQTRLQEIIKKLSVENKIFEVKCQENYINNLREIYQNKDFRHLYSGIFGVITKLFTERRGSLGQNFVIVYDVIKERYAKSKIGSEDYVFYLKIRKLYDHVYLDIGRVDYWENMQRNYSMQFQKTEDTQIMLAQKLDGQKKKVSKLMKSLEKAKNEYITILGIFAAIILGAVGSLTYAGKVLEGASNQQTDLTRLIIIAMVLGAVLVSVANTFLSFILKVNGKEECFKGWSWSECMWLIVIAGAVAIGAAKLLGV